MQSKMRVLLAVALLLVSTTLTEGAESRKLLAQGQDEGGRGGGRDISVGSNVFQGNFANVRQIGSNQLDLSQSNLNVARFNNRENRGENGDDNQDVMMRRNNDNNDDGNNGGNDRGRVRVGSDVFQVNSANILQKGSNVANLDQFNGNFAFLSRDRNREDGDNGDRGGRRNDNNGDNRPDFKFQRPEVPEAPKVPQVPKFEFKKPEEKKPVVVVTKPEEKKKPVVIVKKEAPKPTPPKVTIEVAKPEPAPKPKVVVLAAPKVTPACSGAVLEVCCALPVNKDEYGTILLPATCEVVETSPKWFWFKGVVKSLKVVPEAYPPLTWTNGKDFKCACPAPKPEKIIVVKEAPKEPKYIPVTTPSTTAAAAADATATTTSYP